MADKHEHKWVLFASTNEEEAASAPEPLAVVANLPVGYKGEPSKSHPYGKPESGPHDPDNDRHVEALKAAGVENFDPPPPRKAGDIYVCECGEARHTAPGQSPEEVDD